MKSFLFFLSVLLPLSLFAQEGDLNTEASVRERCGPDPSEAALRSGEFHWDFGLLEMIEKAAEIRVSGKRLPQHAVFRNGELVLPMPAMQGGAASLPISFVRSVQKHLEEALRLSYVDAVIFPDMGHSHFLIPTPLWKEKYDAYPVGEMNRLYAALFREPEMKILYHTAEQLRMRDENGRILPDRRIQWRFFSRNLVGDNRGEGRLELLQNPTHPVNTVNEVPGYRWWGAGFNVSASDRGCFAYRHLGEIRYFDLSLFDLAP